MRYWKLEGNYLVYPANNYEIPLHYIYTPERLNVWIECLSQKQWATPEIVNEFKAIASSWITTIPTNTSRTVTSCPRPKLNKKTKSKRNPSKV